MSERLETEIYPQSPLPISVTQEHIDKGVPCSETECTYALAVKDHPLFNLLFDNIAVCRRLTKIWLKNGMVMVFLTPYELRSYQRQQGGTFVMGPRWAVDQSTWHIHFGTCRRRNTIQMRSGRKTVSGMLKIHAGASMFVLV